MLSLPVSSPDFVCEAESVCDPDPEVGSICEAESVGVEVASWLSVSRADSVSPLPVSCVDSAFDEDPASVVDSPVPVSVLDAVTGVDSVSVGSPSPVAVVEPSGFPVDEPPSPELVSSGSSPVVEDMPSSVDMVSEGPSDVGEASGAPVLSV